jgi:8-oxo-dGTP pyrophosphatase MutT (NUDIX family)
MTADPRAAMIPRDAAAFRALAHEKLDAELRADALPPHPRASDFALNGGPPPHLAPPRAAAVLTPIVVRPEGLRVLLTLRAGHLRAHSGQVAFPGGKVDSGETPLQAALREAGEEIGLEAGYIEPLGWLDPYLTGTGFRIAPLVALVRPGFALRLNPHEVADAFETPLDFLMDEANHAIHEREWGGGKRRYYAMSHGKRYIWGATAGILRNLWERLTG